MRTKDYDQLLQQVEDIKDETSRKDYHAFVYWFIETVFGYDKQRILNSICDGCHDKGVDAVLIDDIERQVCVIQSKYERAGNEVQLTEGPIKQFAAARDYFKHRRALDAAVVRANAAATRLLNEAYDSIRLKGYTLELVFITTHKNAPQMQGLIRETLHFKPGEFSLYDYERISQLLHDRTRDFTPPLGAYHLPYKDADKNMVRTAHHTAWVLTVPAEQIRLLANKFGDRLYRKNVRNFLGKSKCNKAIQETLRSDPSNFWYYNNGITIICDEANLEVENKFIRMTNPQIVNGCQTAMSIQSFKGDLQSDVLVRVIEARDHQFISFITLYQNSSNPVKKRDFKSNDPVQVRLKQEFKRHGYYYEIKRGEEYARITKKFPAAKSEYPHREISNEDVAKVLSAVRIDPATAVQKGSEFFFDELYDRVFPDDTSTSNCLAPYMIYWHFIRDTYRGATTKFHSFKKPFLFKNPSSYHVLSFMYNALRKGMSRSWEKDFVRFCEETDSDEYGKFRRKLATIVSAYFEICHESWVKQWRTGGVDYNSYFQGPLSMEIAKEHRKENKALATKTVRLFKDIGLQTK